MTGETLTAAQKQLAYRVARRSMLEMDGLLGPYFNRNLSHLDDRMCARFEVLLDLPDPDLYDWITGIKPVPNQVDGELIEWIVAARRG